MTPLVAGVLGCSLITILLSGAALVTVNVPRVPSVVLVDNRARAIRRVLALAGVFLIATLLLSLGLIAWSALRLL